MSFNEYKELLREFKDKTYPAYDEIVDRFIALDCDGNDLLSLQDFIMHDRAIYEPFRPPHNGEEYPYHSVKTELFNYIDWTPAP